jgi:hypothetical protein
MFLRTLMVDVENIDNCEIIYVLMKYIRAICKVGGFGGKNCQFGQNVV